MRATNAILAFALLLSPSVAAAQEGDAARPSPEDLEDLFFKAFYQETGLRDFEAAAGLYDRATALARQAGNQDLLVKSLLGRARCLGTMGKRDAALAVAREVLDLDGENAEAKSLLETPEDSGGGIDEELAARIRGLVRMLGTAEREGAERDLAMIGARAVPFLAEGLRSREVGVVDGAAALLARFPEPGVYSTPGAREALAAGLRDPAVVFPEVVLRGVRGVSGRDPAWRIVAQAVLDLPDTARRQSGLRLMWQDFSAIPADSATPFLRNALRVCGEEAERMILSGSWSADARRELLPDLFPLLDHEDPELRRLALEWFAYAKDLQPEWATRIRSFLEVDSFGLRSTAFAILEPRGLLSGEQRTRVFGGFLRSGQATEVNWALGRIAPNLFDANARRIELWDPSFTPALLEAIHRARRGELDDEILQKLAILVRFAPIRDSFPPEDLLGALAAEGASGQWAGYLRNICLEILRQRAEGEPGLASSLLLAALRRLPDGDSRIQFLNQWGSHSIASRLSAESIAAVASDPDGRIRSYAYDWCLATPPLGAVAEIDGGNFPMLPYDLERSAGSFRERNLRVARKFPHPSFAPAVRRMLGEIGAVEGRYDRRSPVFADKERLLELLVACVGEGALPEARSLFMKSGSSVAREALIDFRGEDAMEDLVAYVVAGGDVGSAGAAFSGRGAGELPVDRVVEFFDRLPSEAREAEMLTWIVPHLPPEERARRVLRALSSEDGDWIRMGIRCAKEYFILEAWPRLVSLLENPDRAIRTQALEALDSLRTFRNFRAEYERFGEGGRAKALDDARALLKDGDPVKRKGGALALGALGDAAAVPSLLELLDDPDASVREAALSALERLGGRSKE